MIKLYKVRPDSNLELVGFMSRHFDAKPYPQFMSHALWPIVDPRPVGPEDIPKPLETYHRLDLSYMDLRGRRYFIVGQVFDELWTYEAFTKL